MKPIEPKDVVKMPDVPAQVIEIFNEEIKRKWNGYWARVSYERVIHEIVFRMKIASLDDVKAEWFMIREIYYLAGWNVERVDDSMGTSFVFTQRIT